MYAPSHDGGFCDSAETAAQGAAEHEIFKAVTRCHPETILSEREAVKELLHTSLSYDGSVATTTVRPYEGASSASHLVDTALWSCERCWTKAAEIS